MKVFYFTAEFPGQTHIFLWREYQELLRLGIDAHLVSTRMPPASIRPHSWSEQAIQGTQYLFPFSFADFWAATGTLLSCSRQDWGRICAVFFRTNNLTVGDRFSLLAHLVLATKMVKLVARDRITHIHCTTCAGTANIAMFTHFISGVHYSLSLLGPKLENYGPNQGNKWRYASFGLFQSQKLLRETFQTIPGSVPKLHAFAPVGVNTDVVKRSQEYKHWDSGSTVKIYSCGRLNPIKGHKYVIRAVKQLIDRGYSVHLTIGGEDIEGGLGYRKTIEAEIDRNQLRASVTLLGAVSEEQNISQYQVAHLYLMGSLDEAAGAVAAMEAMAMELPVVMPDTGATSELITSGVDGILVEARSPSALANAAEHLLNNPELAIALGREGRKKIEKKFNHHISANVITEYLTLTGTPFNDSGLADS